MMCDVVLRYDVGRASLPGRKRNGGSGSEEWDALGTNQAFGRRIILLTGYNDLRPLVSIRQVLWRVSP